jgi:hypothetical protein
MRSTPERDAWLKQRLKEAVDSPLAGGSADKLGRLLGYTNGGYIREILDGKKPVRSAIIERADAVPELRGWFAQAYATGADGDAPRTFADLDGPEAQMVMHLRALRAAGAASGADWANGLLELVAEVVAIPDARRNEAIGAALHELSNTRYRTQVRAKDVSTSVGASLPTSPARRPDSVPQSSESRVTTSRRTAR